MRMTICLALLAITCETGCSSLPTAGPTRSQITDQARAEGQTKFALVEVDDHVVAAVADQRNAEQIRLARSG